MRTIAVSLALLGAAFATPSANSHSLTGVYVEARTAEVFAGGCIINSEAGTSGREALLAWRVDSGSFNGVDLAGLAVVAAVAGDANLGVRELGGEIARTRTAVFVDDRATKAQRSALVAMARELSGGTIGVIVETTAVPVAFVANARNIRVSTQSLRLAVTGEIDHTAACGNKQWFNPLSTVHHAEMGMTIENAFSAASLGTKWSDPDKRSAFFGTFQY